MTGSHEPETMSPPIDVPGVAEAVARVRAYHQRTKHMPGRYAPGPGYMDWANQPDPFRRFLGARIPTTARRPMTRCSSPKRRRLGR